MLQITTQARVELHLMLEDVRSPQRAQEPPEGADEVGFRLVAAIAEDSSEQEMDVGLTVDSVRRGDAVFEHNGAQVLLVDRSVADLVDELVLDVVETPEGRHLGLRDDA